MEELFDSFAAWLNINGFRLTSEGVIIKGTSTRYSPVEILSRYSDGCRQFGIECKMTLELLLKFIEERKPAQEEAKPAFNLQKFILDYLNNHAVPGKPDFEWRIGTDWKTVERMQNGIPVPSDLNELIRAIRAVAIKSGLGKQAKSDDIKCLVGDLAMRGAAEQIEKIAKNLAYDPASAPAADLALDALHELWRIRQSPEVHRTIIKHWIWQVKRKLRGLSTVWSIWPNYHGGTGIGKTQWLTDFSVPFGDFALATSISKLLDEERQMMKLTSAYIINLDELSINNRETQYADKEATLGRDQQATLKALLTQTKMTARILGGQTQATRRLTFSCISSANEHLPDLIYDEKTMRRYFEFNCEVKGAVDFTKMEKIKAHILDIWRGVDENLEEGYWNPKCAVWDEVAKEQARYYPTNTSTARWIADQHIVACTKNERDNLQELYDDYKTYCKERGNSPKAYTKWSVDIKHLVDGALQDDRSIYIRMKPEDEE